MGDLNTRTIDHLVHLTPPATVDETDYTTGVIAGGTHADGFTANALVILGDGSYLELISFMHPVSHYPEGSEERTKRETHRWAKQAPGWIDYAFLGTGDRSKSISECINQRAARDHAKVSYRPEIEGGRIRPDVEVLKWLISSTVGPENIGRLPFFCGDVTPRSLRVQVTSSNTTHASTAKSIAFVKILASNGSYPSLVQQLSTVVGQEPTETTPKETAWKLNTTLAASSPQPSLKLQQPTSTEEEAFLTSRLEDGAEFGIFEVGFYVHSLPKQGEDITTPYARIKWVVL
ncbi:glyoxalase-like domain-containing protein [Coprinopsis sp. MPI-PUGE-AT-0042]|nr:glyoxalase-like domain-containing protein [Coprinopsis sp. MPI-PUGE-AT-0042]